MTDVFQNWRKWHGLRAKAIDGHDEKGDEEEYGFLRVHGVFQNDENEALL